MTDQPPVPPTEPTPPPGGATWQGVQPVVERPTEVVPPVPPGPPPPAPPTGPPTGGAPDGEGGGNRGVIIAIVVIALAILGIGGFLLLSGGDDDDDDEIVAVDDDDDEETTTTTTEPEEDTTTTTAAAEETTTTAAVEDTTTTAPAEGGTITFTGITDNTEQLVVEVPDTWTDVDGRPLSPTSPNVQASTNLAGFREGTASGVSYTLLEEQNADPDSTARLPHRRPRRGLRGAGAPGLRATRSSSVGLQELTNCGGQGITLIVIVASNEAGQSVEVSARSAADPVEEIVQHIIDTFNIV